MARKKSELLTWGQGSQIVHDMIREVKVKGGSESDVSCILTSKELLATVTDAIVEFGKKAMSILRVIMKYGFTVEYMVAAGEYDWTNPDINSEHFPHDHSCVMVETDIELVGPFGRWMSNDDIDREFERRGLRDAKLPEMLALGAQHRDEQRKGPVAARGSMWRYSLGNQYVAFIYEHDGRRGLDLFRLGNDWAGDWRFAAVRK